MENDHFSTLFDNLDKDRKNEKLYCDVTISVKNVLFPAHRCILGTFCVYFATLFQSVFQDKDKNILKLFGPIGEEITPETFKSILNFCYTNQTDLTAINVFNILAGSEYLELGSLKDICLEYLKTLIDHENWLRVYRTAVKWNYTSLVDDCIHYFLKAENEELDLNEFTFEEFDTIINRSCGGIKSDRMFEMVTSWIEYNQNDRKHHFDELVKSVDFKSMNTSYFSDKVLTNGLVLDSHVSLRSLVMQKLKSDDEKLLLLGGLVAMKSVQKYCHETWQKCADLLKPTFWSAIASNDTHVFVIDGYNQEGHIQVYDIKRDTWSLCKSVLGTPRSDATASIIDNKLYLFAGKSGSNTLTSVEVFDISGSSCTPCHDHGIPDLKVARHWHASVTRNNDIYFIGGRGCINGRALTSCESINIATCEVSYIQSLHQARGSHAAVLFGDCIIAMGGRNESRVFDSAECFSFITKQWSVMSPMTVPRWGHCAVFYKQQIFVIGGVKDNECKDDVCNIEVYDRDTNQWRVHSALQSPRFGASLVKLL